MYQLFYAPNLLSLSRVILGPIAVYLLTGQSPTGNLLALAVFVLAGITDGLDGWLARKRHQITPFGIALDPIADKLFATTVVVGLIIYRQFPIWMAVVIVGRDLLILLGGLILMRGRKLTLPSNLTGKYTFASIALLLASHIIEFQFGILLTTWLVVILTAASLFSYGRVFAIISKGTEPEPFNDRPLYRISRISFTLAVSLFFLWRLYTDIIAGRL